MINCPFQKEVNTLEQWIDDELLRLGLCQCHNSEKRHAVLKIVQEKSIQHEGDILEYYSFDKAFKELNEQR